MPSEAAGSRLVGERYQVIRVLKRGQGIETLFATDVESGDDVVVKTASVEALSSAAQMRIEHEATVLNRVQSPSFAPLLRFGRENGFLYLVMPYIPGVTLRERLAPGPLSIRNSITVVRSVLAGLGEAHDHGVLHRDVKPANVIVNDGSPIKRATLIDFGLARTARLDPSIRALPVGTARYVSPEQAGLVDHDVDERSDLYSAGIVLFECLAGHPPFDGETVGEVLRRHLSERPPELHSLGIVVPRALDEVIQRLLRKDARDRYQSVDAVAYDLDEIAEALDRGVRDPAVVVGLRDRRRTLTEPAFVARRAELTELEAGLRDARDGSGGLMLLEAVSGGGKTRLFEEAARLAQRYGFSIFRGHGVDHVAAQPYQLMSGVASDIITQIATDPEMVDGIVARLSGEQDSVYDALPQLTDALGPRGTGTAGPEAHGETRAVRALSVLLDVLGSPVRPALVLLDDAQWADEPTLKLLSYWAQHPSGGRHVLVVAAFRSEEVNEGHPLRAIRSASHLALRPLDPPEVHALVESMAGSLPTEAVQVVTSLAQGSPFMASAVLRGLAESGALVHEPGGWHFEPSVMGPVRSSNQAATVLAQRIALLPAHALRLLSVGAILGKDFDLPLAAELSGLATHDAVAGLDDARRRQMVWAAQDSTVVSFVHDKIRDALIERLPPDEQRELHRLAALHNQRHHPDRSFEIAYHFDQAGDPERALPCALEAGRLARAQHSLDVAEQQYRIAERGMPAASEEQHLEIHEGLADVLMLRGEYEKAAHHFDVTAAAAPEGYARASVETKLSELAFKRGDLARSTVYAQSALRRLEHRVPRSAAGYFFSMIGQLFVQVVHTVLPKLAVGRRSLEGAAAGLLAVRLYSRLTHAYWFTSGRVPTFWAHLKELNIAERYPPTPELAQAYSEHAPAMTLVPWFSRGIAYAERSLAIRRSFGDVWGEGQSLNFLGVTLYGAARLEECLETSRRSAVLLERTGDRWELNIARIHIAFALQRLGRMPQALEEAKAVHAAGLEIGDPQASGIGVEIWSKATAGRVPGSLIRVELERETRDIQLTSEVMQAEAIRLLARGRHEDAVAVLDEARRQVKKAGIRQEYVAGVWPWLSTALREQAEHLPSWAPHRRRALLRRARRVARTARRWAGVTATICPMRCANPPSSKPSAAGRDVHASCWTEASKWPNDRERHTSMHKHFWPEGGSASNTAGWARPTTKRLPATNSAP